MAELPCGETPPPLWLPISIVLSPRDASFAPRPFYPAVNSRLFAIALLVSGPTKSTCFHCRKSGTISGEYLHNVTRESNAEMLALVDSWIDLTRCADELSDFITPS